MKYEFSKHALDQLEARAIAKGIVQEILQNPQQVIIESGYTVYQSITKFDGRDYLIRVIINEAVSPHKVITLYKTSKIDKYYEG